MKSQFYATDLSELLGIGDIEEMHVFTDEHGTQILRIEHYAKPKIDCFASTRIIGVY